MKEWIYQLLAPQYSIVKNPGSYNSQLGVPLSVLKMQSHHELSVFEAGISCLVKWYIFKRSFVLRSGSSPTSDLLTTQDFRTAHRKFARNFCSSANLKFFIYCRDFEDIQKEIEQLSPGPALLDWGESADATIRVEDNGDGTIRVSFEGSVHFFTAPFTDAASHENLCTALCSCCTWSISASMIQEGINSLKAVPMRLELKQGVNQSLIIDDTYNNDLAGLQISLDFLAGQQKAKEGL